MCAATLFDGGNELDFADWKELLRNDCTARDKIREFDGLGEYVLKILYENGLDPTVEAIVKDGLNGKPSVKKPPTSKIRR